MPYANRKEHTANPVEFFTVWVYQKFYCRNTDTSITVKTQKSIEKEWAVFVKNSKNFSNTDLSDIMPLINWEDMKKINKQMYTIAKSDEAIEDPYYQLALDYGFIKLQE